MATKIFLNGCNGRMGRMFTRVAAEYDDMAIAAGADVAAAGASPYDAPPAYPVFICEAGGVGPSSLSAIIPDDIAFDVVVDFSHFSALQSVLDFALKRSVPALLCTTGYSAAQSALIDETSASIPIFQSANMSIGISLMSELVRIAASNLSTGFDIEIVESHHNQKLDAPSGTALTLADAANEALTDRRKYVYERHSIRAKRDENEIGIHSIRGGTVVGEHSVIFAGADEVLEIKHSAASREVFAEGAVRAIRFITAEGRAPRRYNMRDLFRQN